MIPKPYSLQTTEWAKYSNALKKHFHLLETDCLIPFFLLQYIDKIVVLRHLPSPYLYHYFNSNISAIHSGGGTTHSVKAFRLFLNLLSRLQYSKKHFKYSGYVFVSFCTLFIEPFTRIFFSLLKRKF